ncbi:MAG TPA: CPBP family intramembrane glutamic endopeptidase [Pirellulales bacterium]|nr:CPBP family intramembrane glutamic endopeptidase [Pirellulales bacterium]
MANRNSQSAKQSTPAGKAPGGWWPVSPEYLEQSRRPLVSLAFIVPLLATYEGGVIYLGPAALRNGADVWLRHFLGLAGFGQYFLLPVLTVGVLLAWHHMTHQRWRLPREIVLGMYCESAVLAFGLLGLGYLERHLSQVALAALSSSTAPHAGGQRPAARQPAQARSTVPHSAAFHATAAQAATPEWTPPTTMISSPAARLVGFCGAGIYEEALFRLLLLPPVAWLLGLFSATRPWRLALAIVATSMVFSAAHYVGPHGEAVEWFSASFRCLAGIFFATLFVYRGFGIAAGTHALYDVLVGLA